MKISISGEVDFKKGGRQGFLAMLAEELQNKHKFRIVDVKSNSDVHLNSISGNIKKGSINFLRVDGIYYDKERLSKNKSIIKSAKSHNHVIFQSSFSKINFEKLTGNSVNSSVILNGARRMAVANASLNCMTIGCSAKWRVNKRLEGLIAAIDIARSKSGKDIKLKIIGDPDCSVPHFCKFTGHIDNKLVQQELSSCSCFAHICHIESCPNSVVEALVCGLPVLCNNIGGTMELVGDDGVISNIDAWNWKPIDDMQATRMNDKQISILSDDILKIINFNKKVSRDDLLIENAAEKYAKLFKRFLS